MSFLAENVAQNIYGPFQAGINDVDPGTIIEQNITVPWLIDQAYSWLDYHCYIDCQLDSGMVVHRSLPQGAYNADSLGATNIDDSTLRTSAAGVNLISNATFTDTVQRMANSRYRFCLKGWARRAGYQIPIPKLQSIGGATAIPDDESPQRAFNVIIGNISGVPLWFARWELWYTVATPPTAAQKPPDDLADHISANDVLPTGISVPISVPDEDATQNVPVRRMG